MSKINPLVESVNLKVYILLSQDNKTRNVHDFVK